MLADLSMVAKEAMHGFKNKYHTQSVAETALDDQDGLAIEEAKKQMLPAIQDSDIGIISIDIGSPVGVNEEKKM